MKSRFLPQSGVKRMLALALLLGAFSAKAQFSIVPSPQVSICSGQGSATFSVNQSNSFPFIETEDISANVNGTDNPGAPPTGSIICAGIPFLVSSPNTCWDSYAASGFTNVPVSTTMNIPCPKSADKIYTLINTGWGSATPNLVYLQFSFTNGASVKVPLNGNVNIRDHRKYYYTNSIGSSVNNGFPISTQQVWGAYVGTDSFRRDMQTITVPSPYNSYYLSSVTLIDSGASLVQRSFIVGLSIEATAPAPVTWHAGSPTGPVVSAGPAPTYTISVSPSTNTTYYAVTDGGGCMQTATVSVKNCCSDTCFWKVEGNNIINGNNIFGTLTKDGIRIQTTATDRGTITSDGHLGWNVMSPSTLLHVFCDGKYNAPSGIRFENLPFGNGRALVVDDQGYVYVSQQLAGRSANTQNEELATELAQLKNEVAALKEQLGIKSAGTSGTDFTVYPNPAKNNLDVRILSDASLTQGNFTIMDIQGRKLLSGSITGRETSVNISTLTPGTYTINLMNGDSPAASKKFVVEK